MNIFSSSSSCLLCMAVHSTKIISTTWHISKNVMRPQKGNTLQNLYSKIFPCFLNLNKFIFGIINRGVAVITFMYAIHFLRLKTHICLFLLHTMCTWKSIMITFNSGITWVKSHRPLIVNWIFSLSMKVNKAILTNDYHINKW